MDSVISTPVVGMWIGHDGILSVALTEASAMYRKLYCQRRNEQQQMNDEHTQKPVVSGVVFKDQLILIENSYCNPLNFFISVPI